ncbi:hypothetical protein L484_026286 [Morus notabilis]|uniref:Uncharacterized protein n=1 Tax=Morus notabilis TaxID=981085 RepID=W9REL0_9ROSA|nr:hypothetical protein L484_026286 [Morus notabilis]
MGKATRWLKGLLGMKRSDKENLQSPSSNASDRKEKKRWSFGGGKSARATLNGVDNNINNNNNNNSNIIIPPSISASDAAWLRSYLAESGTEQSKHAIAVAAATAAAADAAAGAPPAPPLRRRWLSSG